MDAVSNPTPVDSGQNELRLVTIDKGSTSERLICHIETFSLVDTTPAYTEFLRDQAKTNSSRSEIVKAWQGSERLGSLPDETRHRFSWGDYAAVSYVWGDPDDTTSIVVNGAEAQITKNLAAVLHSLRETGHFTGRFRVWIDALCINQQNDLERSAQVAIMRFFYMEAWLVFGFLGPESDNSDIAFELVESLASISDDTKKREKLRSNLFQRKFTHKPGSWAALEQLLLRPYWSRTWIMQELALGGSRMLLLCGQQRIGWVTFCRGIGVIITDLWVARHEALEADIGIDYDPFEEIHQVATTALSRLYKDLWLLTQMQESSHEKLKFSRLLEIAQESECLNERDKVYGMLGLMDADLANAIVPDYTAEVSTVYLQTAQAYISVYKDLEILRDANSWGEVGAPSWVPDWEWCGRTHDSRPDDSYQAATDEKAKRPYNASKGLDFVMPEYQGTRIGCQAMIFDFVDGLGGSGDAGDPRRLIQTEGSCSAYGGSDETALQLAITLYGGRRSWDEHSSSILDLPLTEEAAKEQFTKLGWKVFIEDLFHYYRWTSWHEDNASLRVGGRELREYFSGNIPEGKQEMDCWTAYTGWIRSAMAGDRRLVVTCSGRVGWVPFARGVEEDEHREVQKGDALSIIPGCSTPIILRSTGEQDVFTVVGEAYLQGVMEGELAQMVHEKKLSMRKIWLE